MKINFLALLGLMLLVNCQSFPTQIATTDDNKKLGMAYIFDRGPYFPGTRKEFICDAKDNGDLDCKALNSAYVNK